MTVRFKNQTEYQKSYGVSRSRSVSPRRSLPLAGLRSEQMGISRKPGLLSAARSASSLLASPEDPGDQTMRTAPPAGRNASKRRLAQNNPPKTDSKPAKDSEPGSPAGLQPTVGLEAAPKPEPGSPFRPVPDGKSAKLRPSELEPGRPAAPEPDNQVDQALRWKAGLRPGGQRSRGQRSEYHRQFGWKKPESAASPLLTAERVLYSSSQSVPPFKKNPVSMETEYRRSFRGLILPSGPRLRSQLEHHSDPLFHKFRINRRRTLEPQKKLPSKAETAQSDDGRSPARVQRRRRMLTEYQSSFRSPLYRNPEGSGAAEDMAEQAGIGLAGAGTRRVLNTAVVPFHSSKGNHDDAVKERRQQALMYRRRAWGTNFSRNHLSQLLSEYNALWEPTDSHTEPSTPPPEADSRSASCVEPLELDSNSSRRSSASAGGTRPRVRETQRSPGGEPDPERHSAQGEQEDTDEEEGRLPTPRMKTRPVQRTHHDLTTPATGGAMLVGKLTIGDDSSPCKHKQKCSPEPEAAVSSKASKPKEAWTENAPTSLSPLSTHKQTLSSQPKPIRTKQAPLTLTPPPQHGIQGTLRHPDFQHNGDLGLRFRELPCSRGGCGSDEDDRFSVMSWRSAASCSAASAILERAQKRREDFWGKR